MDVFSFAFGYHEMIASLTFFSDLFWLMVQVG